MRLSGRRHSWQDAEGRAFAIIDLGQVDITFDSAGEARAVAAACIEAAEAIEALTAGQGRDGSPETDEARPRCHAVNRSQTPLGQPECTVYGYIDNEPIEPEPAEHDPGPEVDDEGGMSEYRYLVPEDHQR